MKLFTRYNRINLFATVVIFLLAGIAFYFLLRYVLVDQVDEDLKIERREIQTYVEKYKRLPEVIAVKDQLISYTPVATGNDKKQFVTVQLFDPLDKEKGFFRRLIFFVKVNNQWHEATVSKSLEGTDDLIQSIAVITLITILLILIVSLAINRMLLRKLWQPFYDSLTAMRGFELDSKQPPQFPVTTIDEFTLMNDTLKYATAKAGQDYLSLKEFTENASHELQTPLAIIQSKLDLLIQDEHLSEPQSNAVQSAYGAIQKLSRLNHSLLLLTKIENGQYTERCSINLSQKITGKLEQFEEMIVSKGITVTKQTDDSVEIFMNPMLADIFLNNLLSNAIKYNCPQGTIGLIVKQGLFEINNSGAGKGALDEARLFRRFGKTGQVKDGVGLGVAIIKQVAGISGLTTSYLYTNQCHRFLFTW
jgi:signal transduction histidine kinase